MVTLPQKFLHGQFQTGNPFEYTLFSSSPRSTGCVQIGIYTFKWLYVENKKSLARRSKGTFTQSYLRRPQVAETLTLYAHNERVNTSTTSDRH